MTFPQLFRTRNGQIYLLQPFNNLSLLGEDEHNFIMNGLDE